MNIIEAIKSGRRFRRKEWPTDISDRTNWLISPKGFDGIARYYLTDLDIVADDWEVESAPVTITREQFDAAWNRALDVTENMGIMTRHYLYELVVRELGL